MSVAGGQKLVHSVRMLLEKNPNFVCIKMDFKNAFNEVKKSRILKVLSEAEELSHLAQFAATILAPDIMLESGGKVLGESSEGTVQGDPPSGPLFTVAIQEYMVQADTYLSTFGGVCRCGCG